MQNGPPEWLVNMFLQIILAPMSIGEPVFTEKTRSNTKR